MARIGQIKLDPLAIRSKSVGKPDVVKQGIGRPFKPWAFSRIRAA